MEVLTAEEKNNVAMAKPGIGSHGSVDWGDIAGERYVRDCACAYRLFLILRAETNRLILVFFPVLMALFFFLRQCSKLRSVCNVSKTAVYTGQAERN